MAPSHAPAPPIAQSFGYNDRNELTGSTRDGGPTWTYTYDPIGNCETFEETPQPEAMYTANELNQYWRAESDAGEGVAKGQRYDADGNLVEYYVAVDMNCDGVLNFGDVNPFNMAVTDPLREKSGMPGDGPTANCWLLRGGAATDVQSPLQTAECVPDTPKEGP